MKKTSPKKITLLLVVMALAVLLTALPAHAATFTVNSNQDAPDADAGDGVCATEANKCTLRAAIGEANALEGDDTIGFASRLEGTTTVLGGEQLAISSNIKIEGPGAEELSVSGNSASRVFFIEPGAVAEIEGLTVKDGNTGGDHGGGIYNEGTLTLRRSVITGNTSGSAHAGGGIYSQRSGTLKVLRSTISGNSAVGGGGISSDGTLLKVRGSTISGNSAHQDGGGIHTVTPTARVINSTISGNSAGVGGGINNFFGTLTVKHSTISGNSADVGGGIFNERGTLNLSNTIIAKSTEGGNCVNSSESSGGIINDLGYNISSDSTCPFSEENGSLSGTNPKLKALGNYGGRTETHALRDGSPAINLIPSGEKGCGTKPQNDQRGVKRPQGNKCDTGSFEKEL